MENLKKHFSIDKKEEDLQKLAKTINQSIDDIQTNEKMINKMLEESNKLSLKIKIKNNRFTKILSKFNINKNSLIKKVDHQIITKDGEKISIKELRDDIENMRNEQAIENKNLNKKRLKHNVKEEQLKLELEEFISKKDEYEDSLNQIIYYNSYINIKRSPFHALVKKEDRIRINNVNMIKPKYGLIIDNIDKIEKAINRYSIRSLHKPIVKDNYSSINFNDITKLIKKSEIESVFNHEYTSTDDFYRGNIESIEKLLDKSLGDFFLPRDTGNIAKNTKKRHTSTEIKIDFIQLISSSYHEILGSHIKCFASFLIKSWQNLEDLKTQEYLKNLEYSYVKKMIFISNISSSKRGLLTINNILHNIIKDNNDIKIDPRISEKLLQILIKFYFKLQNLSKKSCSIFTNPSYRPFKNCKNNIKENTTYKKNSERYNCKIKRNESEAYTKVQIAYMMFPYITKSFFLYNKIHKEFMNEIKDAVNKYIKNNKSEFTDLYNKYNEFIKNY